MPRPLLPGEVSPQVTERLHGGKPFGNRRAERKRVMWYNLSVIACALPVAPLVGEPLARRRSLRNAKASPTRRGVTAGDGEVARRKACRKTVKQNGNAPCSTTSQSGLRPPAPLVGEPLARRQSLRNAKASPTRRGVTKGDGEVVRRMRFRKQ